ncbi:MAG: OB-fold nucleic acid binding domain-containing protein [Nanoarchaeota archaeon]
MEEQTLLKLSWIISLTGLLVLIFISDSLELKKYNINEINYELLNKQVKVSGTISRIAETPGLIIFDIADETGTITAIAFKESFVNLTQNQQIDAEGKIVKYKGHLEIQVDKILS